MTTTGALITRAQTILQDRTSVRWPTHELMAWLNDAYAAIVNMRPDASTASGVFACQAGVRQRLTTGYPAATQLVDVIRNVAIGSRGGAVLPLPRETMDTQRRFWPSEPETLDIEAFVFDPRLPLEFMVYPPAAADARLELVYAFVPEPHADDAMDDALRLDASYTNPLLDYLLYRAYQKDAEYASNPQQAATHYQSMQAALNLKAAPNQAAVTPSNTSA